MLHNRMLLARRALALLAIVIGMSPAGMSRAGGRAQAQHVEAGSAEAVDPYRPARSATRFAGQDQVEGSAFRVFGGRLYGALGTGDAGAHRASAAAGLQLAERATGLLNHDWFTARYLDYLQVGFDSEGFAFRMDAEVSLGGRLRIDAGHAALTRIGLRTNWARSAGLSGNELRLPEFQVGYQYSRERTQIELVGLAGYAVLGRTYTPDSRSVVGGTWAVGGLTTVAHDFLRLDAELLWTRNNLLESHAHACFLGAKIMLCLDSRLRDSRTRSGDIAVELGVSAMLGKLEWLY